MYDSYFEQTHNKKEALRKYKGIKNKRNQHLVNKVIELEKFIKEK